MVRPRQSAAIERVRTLIRSVGPTTVDILINGQTGCGKEVTDNNVAAAADRLGVPKKMLYDKIKKYQLVAGRSTEG